MQQVYGARRVLVPARVLARTWAQNWTHVRALHGSDLQAGKGEAWLPDALAVKYPRAARAWGWQWAFPSAMHSCDPRSGIVRRHHLNEASIQKAVAGAAC